MVDEKRVLFILLFLLFLSIAIHSVSGGFAMLFNALQYLLVAAVFFAVLKYKVLLRPLMGEQFIDGKYIGQSAIQGDKDSAIVEEFTISQTLLSTEISGKSKREGALLATWHGKLIDTKPKVYRFLIEVSIGGGETLGVLTLRIEDGTAEGFFQSLEAPHPKHQAVFYAILKDVYETRQSQWWLLEKLQPKSPNAQQQQPPITIPVAQQQPIAPQPQPEVVVTKTEDKTAAPETTPVVEPAPEKKTTDDKKNNAA